MSNVSVNETIDWYRNEHKKYESLAKLIATTLRTILEHNKIDFVDVTNRAKSIQSFSEKIKRKGYKNPVEEMTDLAGIRIITLVERDIVKVSDLLKSTFEIHQNDSIDKSSELGKDRFGYRSVHFICDIGQAREKLPEFEPYAKIPFEIQIRTALQHAWAEIEHDRSYKFNGALPSTIGRRFSLLAGLLELADIEFSSLTEEIENYKFEVHDLTKNDKLDIEINSVSVLEYISSLVKNKLQIISFDIPIEVVGELLSFGINTVADLSKILNADFIEKINDTTTVTGLIRDAMIYENIDAYFEHCWKRNWQVWDEASILLMNEKYGEAKVESITNSYQIEIDYE